MQGVNVSAVTTATATPGGGFGSAMTDADGVVCDQLVWPLGTTGCSSRARWGRTWWASITRTRRIIRSAVPLKLSSGARVAGIDASLAAGASITGHVTDDQGHPVAGVYVSASSALMIVGGNGSAITDANGDYSITGLAAGDYRVQFSAPFGSNLVSEYHPDTTISSMAVPVKVATGADVTGIDASLATGGSITGQVTDGQGHPVQGANVSAESDRDDSVNSPGRR